MIITLDPIADIFDNFVKRFLVIIIGGINILITKKQLIQILY